MRTPTVLSGLALALLLVGAGCAATPTAKVQAPGANVDAAVDGILDASSAEAAEQKAAEKSAASVTADDAAINAYGQANYAN